MYGKTLGTEKSVGRGSVSKDEVSRESLGCVRVFLSRRRPLTGPSSSQGLTTTSEFRLLRPLLPHRPREGSAPLTGKWTRRIKECRLETVEKVSHPPRSCKNFLDTKVRGPLCTSIANHIVVSTQYLYSGPSTNGTGFPTEPVYSTRHSQTNPTILFNSI